MATTSTDSSLDRTTDDVDVSDDELALRLCAIGITGPEQPTLLWALRELLREKTRCERAGTAMSDSLLFDRLIQPFEPYIQDVRSGFLGLLELEESERAACARSMPFPDTVLVYKNAVENAFARLPGLVFTKDAHGNICIRKSELSHTAQMFQDRIARFLVDEIADASVGL